MGKVIDFHNWRSSKSSEETQKSKRVHLKYYQEEGSFSVPQEVYDNFLLEMNKDGALWKDNSLEMLYRKDLRRRKEFDVEANLQTIRCNQPHYSEKADCPPKYYAEARSLIIDRIGKYNPDEILSLNGMTGIIAFELFQQEVFRYSRADAIEEALQQIEDSAAKAEERIKWERENGLTV